MDAELHQLVAKAMANGHNQYAPMPGLLTLRESIAEKIEDLYHTKVNPDTDITITPGGTYAIYTAFTTILEPGDEVYEHLIFDGLAHQSILRYPDLLERSFVCFSFGKVYNCTGWKQGYCVAPAHLMTEFRKIHQFNAFSCFTPTQVALAEFLKNKDAYLQLSVDLQKRRDYFLDLMKETKFSLQPSYGSYFVCGTYEMISDQSDKDFAIRITKEYRVATIPVSAFYQNGKDDKVVRFCFSKKPETIERAVERLSKIS